MIGVTLGGLAGIRRGETDRVTSLGASFGIAMPSFWVGMLLVTLLALELLTVHGGQYSDNAWRPTPGRGLPVRLRRPVASDPR